MDYPASLLNMLTMFDNGMVLHMKGGENEWKKNVHRIGMCSQHKSCAINVYVVAFVFAAMVCMAPFHPHLLHHWYHFLNSDNPRWIVIFAHASTKYLMCIWHFMKLTHICVLVMESQHDDNELENEWFLLRKACRVELGWVCLQTKQVTEWHVNGCRHRQ